MLLRKVFYAVLFSVFLVHAASGKDKIKVVTTLPDLESITKEVGGAKVEAFSIARGNQDPHYVDAKPSFVLKLRDADIFIQIGLDLEVGWASPLLETARNRDIYFGGEGYLDASRNIDLLEIPEGNAAVLRAKGDIHIYGNPHYWLDPRNGKVIARNIVDKLVSQSPENEAYFERRLERFSARIDSAYQVWTAKLAPFAGSKIMAYHNSWPYFEQAFGINIVGFIEPKPGVPPSPSHLVSIIKRTREQNIRVIIISPYFDDKPAQSVANRTDAKVIRFAPSVGALDEIDTYFDVFDYNVTQLVRAFEGGRPDANHSN